MKSIRWNRLAALTGVLAVGSLVVGLAIMHSPDTNASGAKVIANFTKHHDSTNVSVYLVAYAAVAAVFFYGVLASYLRRHGSRLPATAMFAGGVVVAVAMSMAAGALSMMVDHTKSMSPSTAQALNYVQDDMSFITMFVGFCVVGISGAIAILQTRALPAWLGWASLVLGIGFATGFLAWPAFLLTGAWTLVVSVLLYQRLDRPAEITVPGSADIPAARMASEQESARATTV